MVAARGCAYVVMVHRNDATRALNGLKDTRLCGSACKVCMHVPYNQPCVLHATCTCSVHAYCIVRGEIHVFVRIKVPMSSGW